MKTVFVNPTHRTRRKRSAPKRKRAKRRNVSMASNPRRRRTYARKRPAARRPRRRARRRNAGITSFVPQSNPLILSNPRSRTRRRNPPKLNLKRVMDKMLTYGGGGALGYAVNQYGLSMIPNDWLRRAAQVATAVAGSMVLKGELGTAFAGSTMYPLMADIAMYTGLVGVPTDADLNELAADLNELGDSEELYIDDFEPMPSDEEALAVW